jgi:hypothetical protein
MSVSQSDFKRLDVYVMGWFPYEQYLLKMKTWISQKKLNENDGNEKRFLKVLLFIYESTLGLNSSLGCILREDLSVISAVRHLFSHLHVESVEGKNWKETRG